MSIHIANIYTYISYKSGFIELNSTFWGFLLRSELDFDRWFEGIWSRCGVCSWKSLIFAPYYEAGNFEYLIVTSKITVMNLYREVLDSSSGVNCSNFVQFELKSVFRWKDEIKRGIYPSILMWKNVSPVVLFSRG